MGRALQPEYRRDFSYSGEALRKKKHAITEPKAGGPREACEDTKRKTQPGKEGISLKKQKAKRNPLSVSMRGGGGDLRGETVMRSNKGRGRKWFDCQHTRFFKGATLLAESVACKVRRERRSERIWGSY